jgi:hypothetical protein
MRASYTLCALCCLTQVVQGGRSGKGAKHAQCKSDQRGSLTSLFRETSGHNWFFGWDTSPTSDPCLDEWYGVTCDRTGNVINIDLPNNNLAGSFPTNIGRFPKLRQLDVSQNKISNGIPPSFKGLVSLRSLKLSHNHFQGDFPIFVATFKYLRILELTINDFNAPLPQEITSLPLKGVKLAMENYKCSTDIPNCKDEEGGINSVSWGGSTGTLHPQIPKAPTPPCPMNWHAMPADTAKPPAYTHIGSYADRSWCMKGNAVHAAPVAHSPTPKTTPAPTPPPAATSGGSTTPAPTLPQPTPNPRPVPAPVPNGYTTSY